MRDAALTPYLYVHASAALRYCSSAEPPPAVVLWRTAAALVNGNQPREQDDSIATLNRQEAIPPWEVAVHGGKERRQDVVQLDRPPQKWKDLQPSLLVLANCVTEVLQAAQEVVGGLA